jgi:hypothetical protein
MPALLNPTEQVPVQLRLDNPSPDPVTGRLTMTFVPNASTNTDDPNVLLINAQASTRTVNFTFPANTALAQFSLPGVMLRAGTVAGVMQLSITEVQVGGQALPQYSSGFNVTVPRVAPTITNVRILNRTASGFTVEVTGYSSPREITTASFQFTAAIGANLQTGQLQLDMAAQFAAYYQSANAAAAGSAFVYIQPFFVQGNVNAIGSVSVTLSNAQGVSQPKSSN